MYSSVALCSWGEILVLRVENAMLSFANFVEQMSPINVIIMREQLNVKQRQSISETPAKGGGGLVEPASRHLAGWSAFRASDLGSAVAFRVQYSSSAI
jgi:hypothetical protein